MGVTGLNLGCLIDAHNRISLARLQAISWTLVAISACYADPGARLWGTARQPVLEQFEHRRKPTGAEHGHAGAAHNKPRTIFDQQSCSTLRAAPASPPPSIEVSLEPVATTHGFRSYRPAG